MPVLRSLDLFSGVGGITLALHGLARPVAYCDVAADARRALTDNIREGRLPRAPVSADVQELNNKWLKAHGIDGVDMIVGGFPCVGFSNVGLRKGFKNDESRLFMEILRLADETQCPLLFLENVTPILNIGMDAVAEELAVKRGYELRWCMAPAEIVGAPHKRPRWFCLAVRPGFRHVWERAAPYEPFPWSPGTMPPRMVKRATPSTHAGLALMGNSVVPDAVRYAFLHLLRRWRPSTHARDGVEGAGVRLDDLPALTPIGSLSVVAGTQLEPAWPVQVHAPRVPGGKLAVRRRGALLRFLGSRTWPRCGVLSAGGGELMRCACPPPLRRPPRLQLVFDPKAYKSSKPPSEQLSAPLLKRPVKATKWATPRHGCTGASNYITQRTVRDLPTQARFEVGTAEASRSGGLNPVFAEWLMGYPPGWTRAGLDMRMPTRSS